VLLQPSSQLEIDSAKKSTLTSNIPPLLKGFDPADELAKLFAEDEPEQETMVLPGEDGAISQDPVTHVWCDRAVHLRFEQGWSATYAPEDKLNVVVQLPEGPSTEERHVRAVRVGDRILLISGERRQSLYDLLISRVHNHPGFALHVALVRRWQTDVAQAYHQYSKAQSNPLNRLLQELQSEGSAIQTAQAIRNWLTGDVLCPDDPEDLLRLGRILRIGFVTQQYRRIHEAKKRLSTCHRILSRRLNSWLVAQLGHTDYGDLHKVIDEELGITFDDFRHSLLLLRVVEKSEMSSPTLRSQLGRLNRSPT
jgi:hypothetical protein